MTKSSSVVKMPAPIERCVRKQNVLYLHNRNQFSAEYFRFMRRLLLCNIPHAQQAADEKLVSFMLALMTVLYRNQSFCQCTFGGVTVACWTDDREVAGLTSARCTAR